MAKASRKKETTKTRRGGSTFLGILIGLVLGLIIALGVAWYINKLPNPFRGDKTSPSKTTPPYTTSPAPAPKAATPPPVEEKAKVSIPETPAKGETADKKSTAGSGDAFFLQTGSFQSVAEAETLKARLALLGLEAAIQARLLPDKGVWHRVRLGPYTDVDELNRVREMLKQNNIDVALVKVREADK